MKTASIIILSLLVAFFLYGRMTKVNIENTPCGTHYTKILGSHIHDLDNNLETMLVSVETDLKNEKIHSILIDSLRRELIIVRNYPLSLQAREFEKIHSLLGMPDNLKEEVQNSFAFTDSIKKYMEKNSHTYFFITDNDEKNFDKIAERIWY